MSAHSFVKSIFNIVLRSVDKRLGDGTVFLLSGGDEKIHLYVKVRNTSDNYSKLSISLELGMN